MPVFKCKFDQFYISAEGSWRWQCVWRYHGLVAERNSSQLWDVGGPIVTTIDRDWNLVTWDLIQTQTSTVTRVSPSLISSHGRIKTISCAAARGESIEQYLVMTLHPTPPGHMTNILTTKLSDINHTNYRESPQPRCFQIQRMVIAIVELSLCGEFVKS